MTARYPDGASNGVPDTERGGQLAALDAVLARLHEYVYLLDLDGRFRYANQPLLDLWGLTLDQAVGKTFADLGYPPELVRLHDAQRRRVIATGAPVEGENTYTSPTGETGHYEYVFVPIVGPDGSVEAVGGRTQAVTERRRAAAEREHLLAEREAGRARYEHQVRLFEGVASTTPDFVYLFDREGRFQYANRRLLEVWGVALEDAVGRTCLELGYEPWHHEMHMREIGEVLATQRSIRGEVPFRAPITGIFGVYEYIFTPVIGPDGEVTLIAGTTRDITERKQAEAERERLLAAERAARAEAEAAAARAALLQALTAALSQALTREQVAAVVVERISTALGAHLGVLALVTPDGDHLAVAAAERLREDTWRAWATFPLDAPVPLAEAARVGRSVVLPTFDAIAAHAPTIADLCRDYGTEALCAVPIVGPDGRVLGAMGLSFPTPRALADEVGLVETLAGQAAQALERTRLFEAEHDARAAAEAANRAKGEFLSTMSHELRTPLNAIAGYAELLALGLRGPVTDAQRQDLERLRRANRHMAGLVEAVLNFARVTAGRVEFQIDDVRLGPLVTDLEALVGPQLAAKGLTYDHDACGPDTPDQPHVVRADAEKVRQILLNLLTNAIKFTDAGGRVRLVCETDAAAGVIRVRVTDTGRGIATDQLERVFEPFVQVERHRTPEGQQGVGLGLAISRDLARGMGGDLTVESTPGVGSTFTLTLRAAPARAT